MLFYCCSAQSVDDKLVMSQADFSPYKTSHFRALSPPPPTLSEIKLTTQTNIKRPNYHTLNAIYCLLSKCHITDLITLTAYTQSEPK